MQPMCKKFAAIPAALVILAVTLRGVCSAEITPPAPDRMPLSVLPAGNEAGGSIVSSPVSGEGRLELFWYLREQSITTGCHRCGNLGMRVKVNRSPVR
jgi:RHH-type transcriptional regulator, proline utilization regulon repressor / proline dehydrogenase / delta 1-pyrroline-5-carboxylate dehydrogenase